MCVHRFTVALSLATLQGIASAQFLETERMLTRPIEPGVVAPHRGTPNYVGDVIETGSLHTPPAPGSTLHEWYIKLGRPAVALFVDRRLERLAAGWDGTARLMIASEKQADGKTESENLSIALEHKSPRSSEQSRDPVVRLLENALLRELRRVRFKLIDPIVVERALAARNMARGDTEFDSLKGAAAFLLEVQVTATGSALSMIGGLKNLNSGEVVATVRTPVERHLADPEVTEALARAFVGKMINMQFSL